MTVTENNLHNILTIIFFGNILSEFKYTGLIKSLRHLFELVQSILK